MYACVKCDAQSSKWLGRCPECGGWGTVVENGSTPSAAGGGISPLRRQGGDSAARGGLGRARASSPLSQAAGPEHRARLSSGDAEADRVLGGGFVHGSLVLISGEPGIGKSTLVAQIAGSISSERRAPMAVSRQLSAVSYQPSGETRRAGASPPPNAERRTIYVSGEESARQLADRFARLASSGDGVRFLEPFPVETLVATLEKEKPAFAVLDSVQTLTSDALDATAGSPALVRYATGLLLDLAKRTGITILLVGQVTKDGSVAGPKTLEHLVDAVLTLEGDAAHAYRLLRATKNRFGSTDEVGVFEMTARGLKAVENPSARFLKERAAAPGSVVTGAAEGSRVFLVEVQALVERAAYGTPVRRASGFDGNRLQMLCAILSKRGGLKLGDQDVYVNVIGGLELREPAADLAICAAVASAVRGTAAPEPVLYVGEVGLGGEVRSIPFLDRRLAEAKRLGITRAVVPAKAAKSVDGMNVAGLANVGQL